MEDMLKHTETAETAPQTSGKTIFRRIVKGVLWILGIWAGLILALQVILSPSVLGGIADRFASEYIDGDLKFEEIRVNMFRHFPYVGITMENGSLTYPADRFDSLEFKGAQGRLLYHGCGETADTLASFKHFSAGIDVAALAFGKIHISHIEMAGPRIFAHSYDEDNANWNIFRLAAGEDTTETALPHLGIGKVRLTDHPHIVYTDSRDTLFSIIDVKRISFDGKLDSRRSHKNKIALHFDSMMVAGRIAADTIGLGMEKFHIHEHNDHMDMHAEAKALLATRAFGRIHIPISIKGTAAFPDDSVPSIAMNNFKAEIASIPIGFNMTFRRSDGKFGVNGDFSIKDCRAEDIIDGFIKNIIPETKKIRTDASLSLSGTCNGYIGGGELPLIDASLIVPESAVSHKDIKHAIRLALGAGIRTDENSKVNVTVEKAELKTYGLEIIAEGGAEDVMGDDPLIKIDGRFHASADSLMTFLPEDSGISAAGELTAELKGGIRLSQMDIYNFGQADLSGNVSAEVLKIKSPKDTIDIDIKGMNITVAPETKTSIRDGAVHKLLGIGGSIAKAEISFKDAVTARAEKLDMAAKNSVDAMADKDSKNIHPLGGHIIAGELYIEDGEGMSVTLDNTVNGFQMVPKESNAEIPVLSLSSQNKRIYLRDKSNRIILTDAKIRAGAAMNSIERRLKRKAFMDSLVYAHPEVPRDSLMHFLMSRRQVQAVPEWMKEEDFKSGDLNFSLDGLVAEYFRKWDMNGDIDVRTGIIMTPYIPLRNIIRGIDVSFTNNEIKIDNFKIKAGESEVAAKGSLGGLRRALLGRGAYKLKLDVSTEKMDAGELLAAVNAGAAVMANADEEKMAEASDSEFLKMVVADTLDTEDVSALVIVPANLNADIKVKAGNVRFSDLMINDFSADIVMKERCMQIVNTSAATNMGRADFEGFYATRTKKDIKTGFNLNLTDVTSEKVIAMMPAIDTIMPLLKSFKGQIDCQLAATADLDTCMNIVTPTINGVIRIEGENLTMSDNEVFSSLAKRLKFKNRKHAKIDRMTVEGLIKDNTLEVFPFILDLDRYTLALSGLHYLDMSYKYHASIIRSPILFKIGVDIYGPDFDHMKFKIGKPKYKTTDVPVFTAVIDETRLNLAESIRGIFEKGVELAVQENERQEAINEHKLKIGYVNAAEQSMEELTEEEQQQFEEAGLKAEATVQIDSTSIAKTLNKIINEQSGIY